MRAAELGDQSTVDVLGYVPAIEGHHWALGAAILRLSPLKMSARHRLLMDRCKAFEDSWRSSEWRRTAPFFELRTRPASKPVLPICKIVDGRKIEPAIGIYQAAIQFETLIAIASRCDRIELHCYAL